jgi:hypothetical protein
MLDKAEDDPHNAIDSANKSTPGIHALHMKEEGLRRRLTATPMVSLLLHFRAPTDSLVVSDLLSPKLGRKIGEKRPTRASEELSCLQTNLSCLARGSPTLFFLKIK